MTCRNADGTSRRRPPTSRTVWSGSSRVMRYHAPRRSFTFKSARKRAHIPAMTLPRYASCIIVLRTGRAPSSPPRGVAPSLQPSEGSRRLTKCPRPGDAVPRLSGWSPCAGGGSVVFTLLESRRRISTKRLFGVGFASFTVHTAIIAGIVYATLHAAPRDDHVKVDTTVVLLAPQERQKPAEPAPVQLVDALKGVQTVAVPAPIPTDIPPIDLQQRFDPRDYSGSGVEGGRAN